MEQTDLEAVAFLILFEDVMSAGSVEHAQRSAERPEDPLTAFSDPSVVNRSGFKRETCRPSNTRKSFLRGVPDKATSTGVTSLEQKGDISQPAAAGGASSISIACPRTPSEEHDAISRRVGLPAVVSVVGTGLEMQADERAGFRPLESFSLGSHAEPAMQTPDSAQTTVGSDGRIPLDKEYLFSRSDLPTELESALSEDLDPPESLEAFGGTPRRLEAKVDSHPAPGVLSYDWTGGAEVSHLVRSTESPRITSIQPTPGSLLHQRKRVRAAERRARHVRDLEDRINSLESALQASILRANTAATAEHQPALEFPL